MPLYIESLSNLDLPVLTLILIIIFRHVLVAVGTAFVHGELLVIVETFTKLRCILALVLALFPGAIQRAITLVVDTIAATLPAAT